ncbi:MAG: undecaprenyldiphospho-muramoylpentapeptide beta-N-acetylglucosaminyltransferase [Deferribacteres bacterium]|nr:undecaprenyldiphospho-muramoylpentapeptide beta-N-acetylglucosaminyltransferase [Deferribacteres bacterium]
MRAVISGGGTGGHLFPALEIARALRQNGAEVFFVGVKRGIEARRVPDAGFDIFFVPFEGVRGRGLRSLIALLKLPLSFFATARVFKKVSPSFVVCTGGYTSFPVGVMALIFGVPLYLHEQNIVPGWTNLVLSFWAKKVMISFEESKDKFRVFRIFHTGNVVRQKLLEEGFSFPSLKELSLLIVGGSRGARSINRAVVESLDVMRRLKLKVVHQTGEEDFDWVKKRYEELFPEAEVLPFIEDMNGAYRKANLVICRAGATTLFELSAVGRAAVLVPYPFAVGDHQRKNAEVLAKRRAAVLIDNSDFNRENLTKVLSRFYFNRKALCAMAKRMKGALKPMRGADFLKLLEDRSA